MAVLLQFLVPILVFAASCVTIIALILGAINNPEGAVNTFLVKMIDNISPLFPSTPENLKIFPILDSISERLPIIGRAIVYDVATTIGTIFAILIIIKIYKLIPFKAS